MYHKYLVSVLLAVMLIATAAAQEKAVAPKKPLQYKPIKINVSEDGSYYLRVILWAQMWATLVENNPGTIGYDLAPDNSSPILVFEEHGCCFMHKWGHAG
jgi:hypothetical protein